MQYTITRTPTPPPLDTDWLHPHWHNIPSLSISHFHSQSSPHHPSAQAKLQYDDTRLYLFFQVHDRYVLCRHDQFQSPVCQDSCVEFFVQPLPSAGYFNFEINCGGTLLLHYMQPSLDTPVSPSWANQIPIKSSLPRLVLPEIQSPLTWTLSYSIPFKLFEAYLGSLPPIPGQTWRANFFKCADASSHPHWASWSPISEKLSFHQPQYFAPLYFSS